jgi:hypothetical protein
MAAGFPLALVLLAPAATYGPAAPPAPKVAAPAAVAPQRECAPQTSAPNANEIVVCAIKPEGYRLPPDIVEARRLKKEGNAGRPRSPHETYADHSCASIGPMGCRGTPTINLLNVAVTAAEISKRLAKGQEIGSIFETTPAPTDYQYFLEAKKKREEKEAAAAAKGTQAKAQSQALLPPADLTATVRTKP